jgi:hypothetical protein
MQKKLIVILLLLLSAALFSQTNYILRRSLFTPTGGRQTNTSYTADTVVSQGLQGSGESDSYHGFMGFFYPYFSNRLPCIVSINDVPNDQGRQVQVLWNRSCLDIPHSPIPITTYSVWRFDEEFDEEADANIFSNPSLVLERFQQDELQKYFWQRDDGQILTFINQLPALQNEMYALISSTLFDSCGAELNLSSFEVIAHTDTVSIYYESMPDSGYSKDNISPNPVAELDVTVENEQLHLNWTTVTHGSFQGNSYPELNGIWYFIYGSDQADFICEESTLICVTQNPNYLYDLSGENRKFFRIIVSDQPVSGDLSNSVNRKKR